LNGRTLGDSVGKATYVNYSGVTINDYCICSASFLENITSFHAGDFGPNLSDHCPITVNILSRSVHNEPELALRPKPMNIKWSKSVEEQFTANLSNMNTVFNVIIWQKTIKYFIRVINDKIMFITIYMCI
jgi:hypothetical protein